MAKKTLFSKPVKRQTMAEQMAETIRDMILSGDLEEGVALPTEPELAEQFGVSRAVVRDATRILMALGLVEVRHGSGVYVSPIQNEAFGDALLLVLQRSGATAWDVEHFGQIIFPQVAALAAIVATDADIETMRRELASYTKFLTEYYLEWSQVKVVPPSEQARYRAASQRIMQAIFDATHNQVFIQLARPLLRLRNLRHWLDNPEHTPKSMVDSEVDFYRHMIEALAGHNPVVAATETTRLMSLPPAAITAMQQTPVGESPQIPVMYPLKPE